MIEAVPASAEDALPWLQRAAKFDTSGGLLGVDEVLRGSVFQAVQHGGECIGAYALSLSQHDQGAVLWVTACAADLPGVDLVPHLLSIIEQQARTVEAQQVAITTRRRGLIKKLLHNGYEISGITLRKKT